MCYSILEPLWVSITHSELRLEVFKTVTLNCSVFESPTEIVLRWRNMVMLRASSRISFHNSYLLQLRKITGPDADVYMCFIQKDLYTSQSSSVLIISDKYLLNIDKKGFIFFGIFILWNFIVLNF